MTLNARTKKKDLFFSLYEKLLADITYCRLKSVLSAKISFTRVSILHRVSCIKKSYAVFY